MAPSKRRYTEDDDDSEVEIVTTSFNSRGPSAAGYTANPNPTQKQNKNSRNSQAERLSQSIAYPSMGAPDPHPFSYPARPVAQSSTSYSRSNPSTVQPPAKKQSGNKAVPHVVPSPAQSMARLDSHPFSYPAKPTPSQSYAQPGPSAQQPPQKKPRTKKMVDPNAPVIEKRGAREKKSCPKNILDRVDRVMSQRFFMVDRTRASEELREEFKVLGSTGNVYTVIIDKTPSCNCPDATKGNHCKHILFVFLKVLQVPSISGHWYQKALLTSELQAIFSQAPPAPNSVAHARVREAYDRATGKVTTAISSSADKGNRRIPGPDDDCPICYESMHGLDQKKLTWCTECGNALHGECFGQWARSSTQKNNLSCVWCRAKWVLPASGGGAAGASMSEGYLNLGNAAGVDTSRDTSTYYQGPRRGQRHYGYQDYY